MNVASEISLLGDGCSILFADMELHTAAASMFPMMPVHAVHGLSQALSFPCPSTFTYPFLLCFTHKYSVRFFSFQTCSTAVSLTVKVSFSCDGLAPQHSQHLHLFGLDSLNLCPTKLVPFCCVLPLPHAVHSHWSSGLQWLSWWQTSGFV